MMKTLTIILSVIILVYCQNGPNPSKKDAFRLLSMDTELITAIEHYSVLVNQDSLDNLDNHNQWLQGFCRFLHKRRC